MALMVDNLQKHGYAVVPWGQPADVLVVNSCTVTANAFRKTRKAVRAARRRQPSALIAVAGCSATVDGPAWEADGTADLLVPNPVKMDLAQVLSEAGHCRRQPTPMPTEGDDVSSPFTLDGCGVFQHRTRASLKIQDGCSFDCSYCVVPRARGTARSRDWTDTIREAEQLLARGYKELTLTGVNIAAYWNANHDLADLLLRLSELPGEFRLRLSSTEPGPVVRRVVHVMAGSTKVCRFLHLPLQYGEDALLQGMNRHYSIAEFADLAEYACTHVDGLCLGTDIIVGFPGETPAIFEQCCSTVVSLPVNHLHVFTYSPRPGTGAAHLPDQVSRRHAADRNKEMTCIGAMKYAAFTEQHVQHNLQVLTEVRNSEGLMEGWSDNYLRVVLTEPPEPVEPNRLIWVLAETVLNSGGLSGTVIDESSNTCR